jgi:hypothetical protein
LRTLILILIASLAVLAVPIKVQKFAQVEGEMTLNFPFEVMEEIKLDSLVPLWTLRVLVPRSAYSKGNLSSLFRLYSRRHADERERLTIYVYTDRGKLEREAEGDGWINWAVTPANIEEEAPNYDAVFYREGNGAASAGGINEFYSYCPDLSRRQERRTVVLRGTDPYARKRVIETKDMVAHGYVTRVMSYELMGVDPSGTYYGLQVSDEGSASWRTILTVRSNVTAPIPANYLKLGGDRVATVALGWMCAVTSDKGRTWSVWDAEREIPNCKCCDFGAVRNVDVSADGTGAMTLDCRNDDGAFVELHTEDYGRHWVIRPRAR